MAEGNGVCLSDADGNATAPACIANSANENGFHVKKCPSDKIDSSTGSPKYSTTNHQILSGKDDVDSTNGADLPVNLTTPPLTPPRETSAGGDAPVNVNRNNVSDSVHVKATQFSASVRQGAIIGSNGLPIGKEYAEVGHSRVNGRSGFAVSQTVDSEPPALVIVTNNEIEEDSTENEKSMAIVEESHITEEGHGSRNGAENTSQPNASVSKSQRQSAGLPMTTADRRGRPVSEEDDEDDEEEVEDMELVLVEDDPGAEDRTKDHRVVTRIGKRTIVGGDSSIKSMEAESSTPGENGRIVPTDPTSTIDAGSAPNTRDRDDDLPRAVSGRVPTEASHPYEVYSSNNFAKTASSGNRVVSSASSDREAHLAGQTSPGRNGGKRGGEDGKSDGGVVVSDIACSKRAAKVKQFFSTIQQCANGLGREVAEQVQELIHAVLNGTATAEEFHQEIQTVTNYPLKAFTIPFIKDNIKYLQAELKESAQALSDILGTVPAAASSTVALTPQADEDDELPVLPSSSKSMTLSTIRTAGGSSSMILGSSSSAATGTASPSSKSTNPSVASATSSSLFSSSSTSASSAVVVQVTSSNSRPSQSNPSNHHLSSPPAAAAGAMPATIVQVRSLPASTASSSSSSSGVTVIDDGYDRTSVHGSRKRLRKESIDRGNSSPNDIQVISSDKVQGVVQNWSKRSRSDVSEGMVIVTNSRPPPSFPHPPPPPPTTHIVSSAPPVRPSSADKQTAYSPFTPQEHHGNRRRGNLLSEDWGHLDMMLNSVQGMVERTRQSMAALKDRVHSTHAEMERKEVDHDHLIQQRVAEAVDKARRQGNEERQRLLLEANKQVRDAVATVRAEMEQKLQQAQAAAVQEALKEANMQSSSKENCWNCGRRATETCSGCNKARYCGAFCQHKDWANHMHHCASGLQSHQQQPEEQMYPAAGVRGEPAPRSQPHQHQVAVALSTGEMALAGTTRAIMGTAPHQRAVAIPVSLIGRTQDRNAALRLSQGPHPEIIIKSEKT